MHRVLAIAELFAMIAEECKSKPSSLSSLSRTCRLLQEPCINALYESSTISLGDLTRCLPFVNAPLSNVDRADDGLNCKSSTIVDSDFTMDANAWERFEYYAAKIKRLEISFVELDDDVLVTLLARSLLLSAQYSSRQALFSCLKSLSAIKLTNEVCIGDSPHGFALLPFLTPTLYDLSISISGGAGQTDTPVSGLAYLGPLIADFCPNLQSLAFEYLIISYNDNGHLEEEAAENCEHFLFNVIRRCLNLKVLQVEVNGLDPAVIQKMLSLPSLEVLKLRLIDAFSLYSAIAPMNKLHPSHLKSLQLELDYDNLIPVLRALDRTELEEAHITACIYAEEPDHLGDLEELLKLLVEPRLSAIQRLGLSLGLLNPTPVTFRLFRRLLDAESLQELKINTRDLAIYDDDDTYIAKSLPLLRLLALTDVTGLTLHSLTTLSIHCIHLVELSITINAVDVPALCPRTKEKLDGEAMKKMTVSNSKIREPAVVALFLRTVFASITSAEIREVGPNVDSGEDQNELWAKVSQLLKLSP